MNSLQRYDPFAYYAEEISANPLPGGPALIRELRLPNIDFPEMEGTAIVVVGGDAEPGSPGAILTVDISIYGRGPDEPSTFSMLASPSLAKVIAKGLEPSDCSPEGLEAIGFRPNVCEPVARDWGDDPMGAWHGRNE